MPGEQTGRYGSGTTVAFWEPFSIRKERDQPGNPHADGERRAKKQLPSKSTSLSPQKAKTILKHGSVKGHELTKKQRGFLGAVAGKGRKK
jgi:hypothetical protein